jgi:hypothetical protein
MRRSLSKNAFFKILLLEVNSSSSFPGGLTWRVSAAARDGEA